MERILALLQALTDETRLRLLTLLINGELCVCELVTVLKLPQSTISRHLSHLKRTGLVKDRRQGVWSYYRLADEAEPFRRHLVGLVADECAQTEQGRKDREALTGFQGDARRCCDP